jgi:hypothetical protein
MGMRRSEGCDGRNVRRSLGAELEHHKVCERRGPTISAGAGVPGGRITTGTRRAWVPQSLSSPTAGDILRDPDLNPRLNSSRQAR